MDEKDKQRLRNQWKGMLDRCRNSKTKLKRPSYAECTVCDDWLKFPAFLEWARAQDYKGKDLDKDILVAGNKRYSPQTCVFVSARVNSILLIRQRDRGAFPIGVYFEKRKGFFRFQCKDGHGKRVRGVRYTAQEAHAEWQLVKAKALLDVAAHLTDERVKLALTERARKLLEDKLHGRETLSL